MKQQLNQLAAYQPGLSPQALKEKHGIEGELYKLLQMKIYMVLLQKQSKQFKHIWMSYFIILRRAHLHYVRQLVNI